MNGDVFIPSTTTTVQDFLMVSFCKSWSVTHLLSMNSSYPWFTCVIVLIVFFWIVKKLRHTFVYVPFYRSFFGKGKKNIFIKANYWKNVKKNGWGERRFSGRVSSACSTSYCLGEEGRGLMEKGKIVRKRMGNWKQGLGCGKEYSMSTS
jgi:hypothetical protein